MKNTHYSTKFLTDNSLVSFPYRFRIVSVSFSYRPPIVLLSFSYRSPIAEWRIIRKQYENERRKLGGARAYDSSEFFVNLEYTHRWICVLCGNLMRNLIPNSLVWFLCLLTPRFIW